MLAVFCDVNAVVIKEAVVQLSLAVQHALLERLAGCFGIDVNRIKRSLATDIQAISHLRTEANIGDDLAHRNRSDMRAIRRVAKSVASCGGPDISGAIATQTVEIFRGASRKG
jgi:hypothetical protein